jgi:hypothetical protein
VYGLLPFGEIQKIILPSTGQKSRLCVGISIETVEVCFFVTGLATLQIQGVEMSNVRSFEALFY